MRESNRAITAFQAAKSAGMRAYGIGDAEQLTEADRVFKDFTTLDNTFIQQYIIGR